ncbi:MAG: TrkA family potassium uptake protein [Lentimicrobium sp.]|jgi:trk system potassium uptake protein TrkA|nr:TrkA family potassium uptake protein [Lentimicrobium sp.]MDY0025916.1 TrkA family potassium uptake protein [Lentimicrobium sp.]
MKIIIIGLGNFGSALGIQLTAAGHEVIGVDSSSVKAEAYKDLITQTIVLDSTNEHALKTLPLRECDYAVVAIGEDFGASVMTTALLKQANVKHLVSRAINELHSTVLETLGVEMIIRPEKDSASLFADRILLYGVSNAYHISDEYKIVEAFIPGRYDGLTLGEINFKEKYKLQPITAIREYEGKSVFGQPRIMKKVLGLLTDAFILKTGDRLLLFGSSSAIEAFLGLEDNL